MVVAQHQLGSSVLIHLKIANFEHLEAVLFGDLLYIVFKVGIFVSLGSASPFRPALNIVLSTEDSSRFENPDRRKPFIILLGLLFQHIVTSKCTRHTSLQIYHPSVSGSRVHGTQRACKLAPFHFWLEIAALLLISRWQIVSVALPIGWT